MNCFKGMGLTVVLICTGLPISAQIPSNFNFGKPEEVQLHRHVPAAFVLPGNEVAVIVSAKAQGSNGLPDTLAPLLETVLREYDHRIVIDKARPEVTIACIITGYLPPSIQHLTRPGTPAGKNIFTGKQTAAQPGQPYTKVTGELAVSYSATDVINHQTVDAAMLESKINAEYDAPSNSNSGGGGIHWPVVGNRNTEAGSESEPAPTSPQEVNQRMLRDVAAAIAARLVNTDDRITVWLPKGRLEQAAKLAESGLWERMLEQLNSMPASNKPQDEAYRLYDLGVAYEAMGYATQNPDEAFKLFEQATIDYGKALDEDPTDKHLREPQNRIETAMLITKTLSERARGIKPEVVAASEPPSGPDTPKPDTKSEVLTDDSIVDLKRMGADDENIIGQIRDAKQVDFDLSVAGQRKLFGAGVSNAVIKVMRERNKAAEAQSPAQTSSPDKSRRPN